MFTYLYIFIIGTIFGSFYYVVGTRLPNQQSLLKPNSHCTYCHHPLKVLDLIPVLSFILLKGKCRYCHKSLSKEYLLYELLTGFLFLISYHRFAFSYEFFISLIISSLLILIFITDFKYMIILDSPLVISFILVFIAQSIHFNILTAITNIGHGLLTFFTMFLIGRIGNILFQKESLGGGDIKFSFIIGLIFGYQYAMITLVFSTFLALPYAIASMFFQKENEVPFGPFLVGSLFIIYYFLEKFKYLLYFI